MIWKGISEFFHAFVDMFVRPLKIWFPQEFSFWRPDWDRTTGDFTLFYKDEKPLGYWLGHVIAYLIIAACLYWLYKNGVAPAMFVDES